MKVLVSEPLAEEGLALLREHFEVTYRPSMTTAELLDAIGQYDALIVRSATQVNAQVLAAGKRLRVVGRAGVGTNNIDVDAATSRGIVVVNVPDGNTIAACEHTMAMMLALARNLPQAAQSLAAGRWERQKFVGVELYGKVLGVIGLGRIGTEVSKRAQAFGMKIIGYDPFASPAQVTKLGIKLTTLEEVLASADFLTIHSPLTPQTRNMIGARELAMMKRGARVINCARGGIINERALYEALAEGKIAGAALDVFEQEPPGDNPLLSLPNVIGTPHLGASTVEAQVTCAVEVANQVIRCLTGQPVRNAVNLPSLPEKEWEELVPLLPLAEVLGRIFSQALPGPMEVVEVGVHGSIDGRAADILANTALAGLLSGIVDTPVNSINAPVIAKQKGIHMSVTRMREDEGRPSLIEIRAGLPGKLRSISGYLSPLGQPRIAEIMGLPLDMAPAPYMLMDFHQDRPGIIGRVGTILGDHRINIAAMYVGRHGAGGEAVMVLAVDAPVPDAVLAQLRDIPSVQEFRAVSLPSHLLGNGGRAGAGGQARQNGSEGSGLREEAAS